jgi:hypothetical protein
LDAGDALVRAWHDAAEDLRITVVAPYEMVDEVTGARVTAVAWIQNFGATGGAVVLTRHSEAEPARSLAQTRGQFCSFVDEESYAQYDRRLFVATLNDWGWHGDHFKAPDWYSGKPWTV